MTGDYFGDASNTYSKGTKYYEILGTSTSNAIAVQEGDQWVKAVYIRKAPFHIMNILSSSYFIVIIVIMALIILRAMFRSKIMK